MTFQVGGIFTAVYVMVEEFFVEEIRVGGVQLSVSLGVCPALLSAFFSFFSRTGIVSVRRAQGSHRKPLEVQHRHTTPQQLSEAIGGTSI